MVLYGAEHLTERAQAYDLLERAARLHWGWDRLPEMAREERGKPYFPGAPQYHFNLSHSGPFALCALSDRPVGVDIQVVRPVWPPKLVDRSCTPEERAWLAALPEEDGVLSIANSLWFRDSEMLTVEESFLEANALWYGADVYEAPFDDATVSDVNAWVDYHTGGMIPAILEEIPENAMVYLVNALAFDGRWETPYREYQVRAGTFTREDGTVREAELMYSTEDWYLSDGKAQGFLKYYEGCDYAFAALLPPEGVPLADYIASLDGQKLARVLDGAGREEVQAAIPKFEMAYSAELSRALQDMSMTDAFAPSAADFSAMGTSPDGPLYISRVLHRTHLTLDERGTKAGAATAVEMDAGSAFEPASVYLTRPFLYLLIDCEAGLPLFIGTVRELEG